MRRPVSFLPTATVLAATAAAVAAAALPASAVATPVPFAPTDPQLTVYAGNGTIGAPVAGPALASPRNATSAMDVTSDGTLYALDLTDHVVERITPDGQLSIVAGDGTSSPFTPGPARSSGLGGLSYGLAALDDGTLFLADWATGQIAKVTPDGHLSIFAGDGTRGMPVDGPATASPLGYVVGLDTDADGNVYFALQDQFVVVKITPGGTLTRIAGTGAGGPMADGPALSSTMVPRGGTVLPDGTYYVSSGIPSIAKIAGGTLKVIDTTISTPVGISHDEDDNLYVASNAGARITRLGPDGSSPTPMAGDMTNGLFSFIPGDPLSSSFFSTVVAADPSGAFYTVDYVKQIGRVGAAVPSRPRAVRAVVDAGGDVTVSFAPPSSPGLSAITGYEVSADGGTTWTALPTTASGADGRRSGVVRGLAVGSHGVVVRAVNASGAGFVPRVPETVVVGAPAASTPSVSTPAPVRVATPAPAPAATPTRTCVSIRHVKLNWRVPRGTHLRSIVVTVDGHRVSTLTGKTRSTRVTLPPRLPRTSTVRITATTTHGKGLHSTRTYRLCAPRASKSLSSTVLR